MKRRVMVFLLIEEQDDEREQPPVDVTQTQTLRRTKSGTYKSVRPPSPAKTSRPLLDGRRAS